jgi:16S rRNA (adenine1518-N6/adenine1519-N6)-dimethyltransferase
MIQEEVAQKLVKTTGRDYGYSSLFFQHFFTLTLLDKVPPTAFFPPPKVTSRLVYFRPKEQPEPIEREEKFWVFIKQCFAHPRRTLRNNLATYSYKDIPEKYMPLRAQQMTMADFLAIWKLIIS